MLKTREAAALIDQRASDPHVMAGVPITDSPLYLVLEQPVDVALALPNELRERLLILIGVGFIGALTVAWGIGWPFTAATVAYMTLTHFYSFVGKNLAVLDILLISLGFVLRAVAGALAIGVPYSDWFVLCTFFVALFIAVAKRRAELHAAASDSGARPVLDDYTHDALAAFGITAMAAAVISYSLWVQDELEHAGGEPRMLLFTVPFVILAIFRYHLLVERGEAGERPEDTLLSDRPIQLSILGFALVAVAAFYVAR